MAKLSQMLGDGDEYWGHRCNFRSSSEIAGKEGSREDAESYLKVGCSF